MRMSDCCGLGVVPVQHKAETPELLQEQCKWALQRIGDAGPNCLSFVSTFLVLFIIENIDLQVKKKKKKQVCCYSLKLQAVYFVVNTWLFSQLNGSWFSV